LLLPQAYQDEEQSKFFGSGEDAKTTVSRSAAVAALGPILSALTVEAQFEPALLDEHTLRTVVTRVFDALLPPPSR
jgi:hypothetical protein